MDRSGDVGEEGYMKAVVTGGAGFIGSNLSDGWANRNTEVIIPMIYQWTRWS